MFLLRLPTLYPSETLSNFSLNIKTLVDEFYGGSSERNSFKRCFLHRSLVRENRAFENVQENKPIAEIWFSSFISFS